MRSRYKVGFKVKARGIEINVFASNIVNPDVSVGSNTEVLLGRTDRYNTD